MICLRRSSIMQHPRLDIPQDHRLLARRPLPHLPGRSLIQIVFLMIPWFILLASHHIVLGKTNLRFHYFKIHDFIIFQFVDIHGHRGLIAKSSAGERDLRLDNPTLPLLQNGADWMEEQCKAQLIAQQMLPKGWEGSRKFHFFFWLEQHFNLNINRILERDLCGWLNHSTGPTWSKHWRDHHSILAQRGRSMQKILSSRKVKAQRLR